jgi:hypothetical protein
MRCLVESAGSTSGLKQFPGNSAGKKQKHQMKDITESELSLVEGGAVPWIVMLFGGAMVGAVANGWSDFKDGVAEAYARELNAK